jgi:hypothetical protein
MLISRWIFIPSIYLCRDEERLFKTVKLFLDLLTRFYFARKSGRFGLFVSIVWISEMLMFLVWASTGYGHVFGLSCHIDASKRSGMINRQ